MGQKIQQKIVKYLDKTLSKAQRKVEYDKAMDKMMNPLKKKDFDPATFEPMTDHPAIDIGRRPRIAPEGRLPTLGMKPKQIREGQMVGMYESKQDLYLLIAHVQHELLDKIEQLEDEIATLKNKHKS